MKNPLVSLLILLALCWGCNDPNRIVVPGEMEEYAEVYLRTYRNLVEEEILPAFRRHLSFYEEYPFSVLSTISARHGAALEFVPSEEESFRNRSVTEKVEHAVFKYPLNFQRGLERREDGAVLMYPRELQHAVDVKGKHATIHDVSATTSVTHDFVNVATNASLHTKDVFVDGVAYPHAMFIKGSNQYKHWTPKTAQRDAQVALWLHARRAFIESEEFRKFITSPQLTDIAKRILEREEAGKYGGQYGLLLYEEDLQELYATAKKYKVPHEFAENIYRFYSHLRSIRPGFWERHLDQILTGLITAVLFALLLGFFHILHRKGKSKRSGDQGSL